jgi:hypothetical protein
VVYGGLAADRGTMLAVYWLDGDGSEHWDWSAENVARLIAEGRMRPRGRPRWIFRLYDPWSVRGDRDSVPAEMALDRRFPSVFLTILEVDAGGDLDQLHARLRDEVAPTVVAAAPGVELCVGFRPGRAPLPMPSAADLGPAPSWAALLWFVDEDPDGLWDSFLGQLDSELAGVGARMLWASPFVGTVPGTDQHMDDLWLEPRPQP